MKQNPAAELEALALRIPEGKVAQYFYGDNVEGYFEGFVRETAVGSGYWLDGRPILRDVACCIGEELHTHEQSPVAEILPHAVRHARPGNRDEFSILHRRRAAAVRIEAKRPGPLGALLLFDAEVGAVRLEARGAEFLAAFSRCPMAMGIAATEPLVQDAHEVNFLLPGLSFVAQHPVRRVDVYLAFDPSPERALQKARELRDGDALAAHAREIADVLGRSRVATGRPDYDLAVAWAKLSSYFLVTEQFGKGIWAGLPWFKNNWGRDTFIAVPGTLLVSGLFDDAREVILNFLRWQDQNPQSPSYGRVPNRVNSPTDVIYNTADGTPWLLRELYEYLQHTGDLSLARQTYPQVKLAIESAIERSVDAEGFLVHDDADTWMDARIQGNLPWSARGNRANDIQALWHNALLVGERLAGYADDPDAARRWRLLADKLRANFSKRFWNPRAKRLADRIAADNRRDEKVRPNQLMVLSIPMIEPLLDADQSDRVVANAVSELLFPHGIASLSPRDPYFHPYHHNDEWHHFDAAYHNGTVWGWNAGFAVTAMCLRRQTELAAKLADNLADQILHLGCRGTMSELVEAIPRKRGELRLSGTWAQAWSTSEFARNAHQDFGGFHPRLLDRALHLRPHLPASWKRLDARFPFGQGAALLVRFRRQGKAARFEFLAQGHPEPLDLRFEVDLGNRRFAFDAPLLPGRKLVFSAEGPKARLGKTPIPGTRLPAAKPLRFAKPVLDKTPPCLRKKNYLQQIVESGLYR